LDTSASMVVTLEAQTQTKRMLAWALKNVHRAFSKSTFICVCPTMGDELMVVSYAVASNERPAKREVTRRRDRRARHDQEQLGGRVAVPGEGLQRVTVELPPDAGGWSAGPSWEAVARSTEA
jgi:hypothetical protein